MLIKRFPLAGLRKVGHPGDYNNYYCLLTLLPDVSVGVWVCTNSADSDGRNTGPKLVSQFALDLLMGKISVSVD